MKCKFNNYIVIFVKLTSKNIGMTANRLSIILAVTVFWCAFLAGCDKDGNNSYNIRIPGSEMVSRDKLDEVKCVAYLGEKEQVIAKAAYDPQGFTMRLPVVLPDTYLVNVKETMPTAQIDDPQAKWQWAKFECYKNGETGSVFLSNGTQIITYIYIYADRPVKIDGKHIEDHPVELKSVNLTLKGSIEHNWEAVQLKKGWNLVAMKNNGIIAVGIPFDLHHDYSLNDQEYPIFWYYELFNYNHGGCTITDYENP